MAEHADDEGLPKRLRAKLASLEAGQPDDLQRLRARVQKDPAALAVSNDLHRKARVLAALSEAREGSGLTQAEVAEAMGTTQSAISDLERGRSDPRLSTLQRYANVLDMRLDLALMRRNMPQVTEDLANEVWRLIEARGTSRILGRLLDPALTPKSLAELAKHANLPAAIARTILLHLVDQGWARRPGKGERFVLMPERMLVVGASVRHDHVVGALTDLLTGRVIGRLFRTDLREPSPRAVVDSVAHVANELKESASELKLHVLGLGVTMAGVVNGEVGSVDTAPDLTSPETDWPRGVLIGDDLQKRTGLRVVVGNDANALAVREYLVGMDRRSLVLVLLSASGQGIGAAVVVNGALVRGDLHAAGEIGHVGVGMPSPGVCRCGAEGCLEQVASERAILRKLNEGQTQTLADAADLVASGDVAAAASFRDAGNAIGRVLSTVVSLIDPSRLVVCGPKELVDQSAPGGAAFLGGVRESLSHGAAKGPEPDPRVLTPDVEPLAASSLVVQSLLEDPLLWVPSLGVSTPAST